MLGCIIRFYPPVRSHPQVPVVTTTKSRHGRFAHLRHAHHGLAVPGLPVSNSSASCVQSKVAKISVPLMHNVEEGDLDANWKLEEPSDPITTRSLLCLSNGHGEDSIAASILTQILTYEKKEGVNLKVEALPLVGEGHVYRRMGIPTVGPAKTMPSGGFIYMDVMQTIHDIRAGLVSLTLEQWGVVADWVDKNPDGVLLAVGDVFPLAVAWLASKRLKRISRVKSLGEIKSFYAFVGTAKSEFYVRDSDGSRLDLNWLNHLELLLFPGSVYYPWERALMSDTLCRLVVPRDGLTAEYLQKHVPQAAQTKIQNLGNPMMDDLQPIGGLDFLEKYKPARFIAVLPGSRAPEVHSNWKQLVVSVQEASLLFTKEKLVFLVPVVPFLDPGPFIQSLTEANWQPHAMSLDVYNAGKPMSAWAYDVRILQGQATRSLESFWPANNGVAMAAFERLNAVIILIRGNYSDVAFWAETAIAMAGTATEQLVGQGKPVFSIPGQGPQFTASFAEAQSRLLGKSIILNANCKELAKQMKATLSDSGQLARIKENGCIRMGEAGAGRRIAEQLWNLILQ